jgi:predicted homoserine dehydrogenase-like protein
MVEKEVINIGIVGAGRTGTPLIKEFLGHKYICIKGIIDLNLDAPGMKLAKKKGILASNDVNELVKIGENIDLIFDVSGDPNLRRQIVEAYQKSSNKHTLIIHETVARLIITLALRKKVLVPSLHPKIQGI